MAGASGTGRMVSNNKGRCLPTSPPPFEGNPVFWRN
ncbi:hypothetical protein I656_00001 [Geobacillus sp. WSUCF1]|nr:hypothetical protein I656_00001 [Geobacillus sp. WSUCF1]